ncbi:sigma-70 family RNA polymerase sigma factor [Desemzia sp. RIT804]|uniref:sigma-70 family RNA polymerase sigma factor n=1 Tax=Desemzia sp. RIT 804 TaxID=2810209 RepID=UPI00194F8BC1|nr:sigma-70 family RNA polymerase sigma factor [Desemzia sp. RIT 804]MBM6615352.1 sigma-70 family RNA polymerase sigma factor [Desemzia sp. RIT 804]
MMRKLTEENERDFFDQYSGMVHGTLKRLGVWHSHADYDDFVQQGLLKLVEAYENYPKDFEQMECAKQFGGYAYQKVYWHMIDLLRKQKHKWEREMAWPEDLEANQPDIQMSIEQSYQEMDLLKNMLPLLTKKEQAYLVDAVVNRLSVTEIAQKQGVSRKTVYEWKKKVAEKLVDFLEILKS